MHYVYLLKLKGERSYVGSTSNLKRRLEEHREGKAPATKKYLPLKLITYLCFSDRLKALRFEVYLKTGSGRAFRKKYLEL